MSSQNYLPLDGPVHSKNNCLFYSIVALLIIVVLSGAFYVIVNSLSTEKPHECIDSNMSVTILESIPEQFDLPNAHLYSIETVDGWLRLINSANKTLSIAAFYVTLSDGPRGIDVYNAIVKALERGVEVTVAQNTPSKSMPAKDTISLSKKGAKVIDVDFPELTGGVLHTKFFIADEQHFYLGSANCDWRSLLHVKELGVLIENSPEMAKDLLQIFDQYVFMGLNQKLPSDRRHFATLYHSENPFCYSSLVNGTTDNKVFISAAPPSLPARRREDDLESILRVIDTADEFCYISVMEYLPLNTYTKDGKPTLWMDIDVALRRAAVERGVAVRLLVSKWSETKDIVYPWLHSLNVIPNIEVKLFEVPDVEEKIPYTRVNHAKYMVTDQNVFIGTSNWSESYFTTTAGASLVFSNYSRLSDEIMGTFNRDFESEFASNL
ncbi:hypothetical protein P9112_004808 [Eukaryota sp. TZLM1-RC]